MACACPHHEEGRTCIGKFNARLPYKKISVQCIKIITRIYKSRNNGINILFIYMEVNTNETAINVKAVAQQESEV